MGRFKWRPQRIWLIDSINQLTNTEDCTDAVLLHQRTRWSVPLWMAVMCILWLVIYQAGSFLDTARPGPGSSGFLLILVLTNWVSISCLVLPGRRWVLARSGPSVLLAETPRLWPKATRIVEVATAPLPEPPSGGLFIDWFTLFGRRVVVPLGWSRTVRRIIS